MKIRATFIVAASLFGAIAYATAQHPDKDPVIATSRPVIVAFYRPASRTVPSADDNESLSDFQFYAEQVKEPLTRSGISFHVVYANSFRIRFGSKISTFDPKENVGYFFYKAGKQPHFEHGVLTDADILNVSKQYFSSSRIGK